MPRRFAIASKEVSVEQYQRFVRTNEDIGIFQGYLDKFSPDPSGPMIGVSWYGAAAYCNWLSEQEGVAKDQWCYLPVAGVGFDAGMTIPADVLQRAGYRLPTETEWEFACRSGTTTSRYHGASVGVLGLYARRAANSQEHTWPGGSLLPNDLGLFDMLGNVFEWCQDRAVAARPIREKMVVDVAFAERITDNTLRTLRGSAFSMGAQYARSAGRSFDLPSTQSDFYGFRPARTFD